MTNNNKVLVQEQNNFKKIVTDVVVNYHLPLTSEEIRSWKNSKNKELAKWIEKTGMIKRLRDFTVEEFAEKVPNWHEDLIQEMERGEKMDRIKDIIEYWKTKVEKLEKYVKDNLTKHQELNDRVLKQVKEKEEKVEDIYLGIGEPQELLKKVKNGKLDEVAIELIEKGEQDANVHLQAIATSEIKNKEIAGDLRGEVEQKSQKLEKNKIKLNKQKAEIEELKRQLQEKSEKLEKVLKENKKQKIQISQLKETLEKLSLSLSKKQSKFKQLKAKIKTNFHQSVEKKKHQVRELIARIEVRTK